MLWSVRCSLCNCLGASPCAECAARLVAPGKITVPGECDSLLALFAYDEHGSKLIHALKYENDRTCLSWAGTLLAAALDEEVGEVLVTWAPTTAARRRSRGYDQAELIARRVARGKGLRCRSSLSRMTPATQTGRTASARIEQAPSFLASARVRGREVLLVDDVCTTGATLTAAAGALRRVGASRVYGAVLAYTEKRVAAS